MLNYDICVIMYIYIYTHIHRERHRERERDDPTELVEDVGWRSGARTGIGRVAKASRDLCKKRSRAAAWFTLSGHSSTCDPLQSTTIPHSHPDDHASISSYPHGAPRYFDVQQTLP